MQRVMLIARLSRRVEIAECRLLNRPGIVGGSNS